MVYVKGHGGYLTSPWHGLETGVYRVAADGKGKPERLAEDGRAPQFGASGDAVYVTRTSLQKEVDFSSKLVRIDLADRKETDVATSEFVSQYAVSPDGRWLAFQEREHAYVTPLPMASKPIAVGAKMDALPVRQLDVDAGEYLGWSGDSAKLHFGLGERLFTTELRNAFAFVPGAPRELPKADAAGVRVGFTEPSDVPAGVIAITGARIVTMKGDEVIADGTHRRRRQPHRRGRPEPSACWCRRARRQIDAHGKTIIPGIVDVHWHGGMGDDGIVPQQSWINYASLAFGVTTLHDPSNDSSRGVHARPRCSAPASSPARASSPPARSCTARRRRSRSRSTASTTRSTRSSARRRSARSASRATTSRAASSARRSSRPRARPT